ncbi:MAG: glycoside hydrolase family 2, partial [Erysipelotrichaceae bacterium]|nr:glycoside hydrolase family 2 [Erysipelotrichaceae bacterium]
LPDAVIDSASGWFDMGKSDVLSLHRYNEKYFFGPSDRPVILSECGGFIRQLEETKKAVWGYGKANSEKELTDKIVEMHEKMILPSIENGLCGYIMTQISDVENELNGLFSYDRQVCKVDQEAIKKANQRLAQFYESKC